MSSKSGRVYKVFCLRIPKNCDIRRSDTFGFPMTPGAPFYVGYNYLQNPETLLISSAVTGSRSVIKDDVIRTLLDAGFDIDSEILLETSDEQEAKEYKTSFANDVGWDTLTNYNHKDYINTVPYVYAINISFPPTHIPKTVYFGLSTMHINLLKYQLKSRVSNPKDHRQKALMDALRGVKEDGGSWSINKEFENPDKTTCGIEKRRLIEEFQSKGLLNIDGTDEMVGKRGRPKTDYVARWKKYKEDNNITWPPIESEV